MTEPQNVFTPDDLTAAVMLIDHACQEGAFRGWELINQAQAVRNRLLEFAQSWQLINQNIEGAK